MLIWILFFVSGHAWAASSSELVNAIKTILQNETEAQSELANLDDGEKADQALQKLIPFLIKNTASEDLIVNVYAHLLNTQNLELKSAIESEISNSNFEKVKALIKKVQEPKKPDPGSPFSFSISDFPSTQFPSPLGFDFESLNQSISYEEQVKFLIEKAKKWTEEQIQNLRTLLNKITAEQKKEISQATQTKLTDLKAESLSLPDSNKALADTSKKEKNNPDPKEKEKEKDVKNQQEAQKKQEEVESENKLQEKKREKAQKKQIINHSSLPGTPLNNKISLKSQILQESAIEFTPEIPGITKEKADELNEQNLNEQIVSCIKILSENKNEAEQDGLIEFLIQNLKMKKIPQDVQEQFEKAKVSYYERKGDLDEALKIYQKNKSESDSQRILKKKTLQNLTKTESAESILDNNEKKKVYSALNEQDLNKLIQGFAHDREKKCQLLEAKDLISLYPPEEAKIAINRLALKKEILPLLEEKEKQDVCSEIDTEKLYALFNNLSLIKSRIENPTWLWPIFRFFRDLVKEPAIALEWGRRAADLGHKDAIDRLSKLPDYFDILFLKESIPNTFDSNTIQFIKSWEENFSAVLDKVAQLGIGDKNKDVSKALTIIRALEEMIKKSRSVFAESFIIPPDAEKRLFLYLAELLEKNTPAPMESHGSWQSYRNGLKVILDIYEKLKTNQNISQQEFLKHKLRLQTKMDFDLTAEDLKKMSDDIRNESFVFQIVSWIGKKIDYQKDAKEAEEKLAKNMGKILKLFDEIQSIFSAEILWLEKNPKDLRTKKPVYVYYIKGRFMELQKKSKEAKDFYLKAKEQGCPEAEKALSRINPDESKNKKLSSGYSSWGSSGSSWGGSGSSWGGRSSYSSSSGSGGFGAFGGFSRGSGGSLKSSKSSSSGKTSSSGKKISQKPGKNLAKNNKRPKNTTPMKNSASRDKELLSYPMSFSPIFSTVLKKSWFPEEPNWKLPPQSFEKKHIDLVNWNPVYLINYQKPLWENKCMQIFAKKSSLTLDLC